MPTISIAATVSLWSFLRILFTLHLQTWLQTWLRLHVMASDPSSVTCKLSAPSLMLGRDMLIHALA